MPEVFVVDREAFENDWVSWNDKLEGYISLCPPDEIGKLTSSIPDFPFPHLRAVVERSRAILTNRSPQEIEAAAIHLRWIINSYFYQFRYEGERRFEYLKFVWKHDSTPYINDSGALEHKPRAANAPQEGLKFLTNYPMPTNTSEFTALKRCIDDYDSETQGFQNASKQEYFAVLALWLAADCIDRLETDLNVVFKASPNNISDAFIKQSYKFGEEQQDVALAGIQFNEASNAIAYAEKIAATAAIEESVTKKFKHAVSIAASSKAKLGHKKHYELQELAEKLSSEYRDKVAKGERKPLSTMAFARHIYPIIEARATAIGRPLSQERGFKTVYDWLRAFNKIQKDS